MAVRIPFVAMETWTLGSREEKDRIVRQGIGVIDCTLAHYYWCLALPLKPYGHTCTDRPATIAALQLLLSHEKWILNPY